MPDNRTTEATIRDLVIANRILAHEGVIDDFGHVSVRHPDRPDRYFLARSRSPEIVTVDDIVEFELDGTPVHPETRKLYKERALHGAIYMDRSDVNAVAHHHARSVLPFTITDLVLRPVFHMAAVIGNEVPKWDSQAEFGDTDMLVDDLAKGHSLAKVLGQGTSAILRGHGSVCAAQTLAAVCFISVYLAENARVLLETLPHGTPTYLTPGEVEKTAEMMLSDLPMERAWAYYTARAGFAGI
ncbi:class II aldolase/adducin family protein [Mesorhizobium sp. CAU 1741]|uniref:class II aldolase/adducin family protein n=1 Tax=Mesorhizobium sp. CAU 1741 TaxID=3140366 RepID=UPI00325B0660